MHSLDEHATPSTIGVFGGAFDPPHIGHVMLPALLRARAWVDRVLVAPCADHPLGKKMAPFGQRLGWVRSAMRQHGGFVEVTDLERRLAREHGPPSFTLRLLEAVAAAHPSSRVRLVIGSDIVQRGEVSRWHRWDEIERRFSPLVVPRAGYADAQRCALPEVSSTAVRDALAARDWDAVGALVPAAVVERMRTPPTESLLIVGDGNAAAHAEPWLCERGFDVTVMSGRAVANGALPPVETRFSGVWILAADPAISAVAAGLRTLELSRQTPILHGAGGRLASDVLAPCKALGHPVGVLHPICALRKELPWPSRLGEAAFGVAGDPQARALIERVVAGQPTLDLSGLDAPGRAAYHGACALVANHLSVLLVSGRDVLVGQGHAPQIVQRALGLLLRSALDNLLALGIPQGVTGPAARGDQAAVAAHVDALPPEVAELYATLSLRLETLLQTT